MEATAPGPNRTGVAIAPEQVAKMLDAVKEFSPPKPLKTLNMDVERQSYITEAESVGSVPPTTRKSRADGDLMTVFLDKLGERLAFERTGTRLYDALLTKYLALENSNGEMTVSPDDEGAQTLQRIRAEELSHFQLLGECIKTLGGDPTAQTPCADVAGAASIGLMQVITDPRTTLAQSLNTILIAELADNAGWELLSELAMQVGQKEMAESFTRALDTESDHLTIVRNWLKTLITEQAGSPAV